MSTSAQISPAWKQEVNRRVAEHRGRKGTLATSPAAAPETQHNASRRAMEAAARVAARYANAPSYGDVMVIEPPAADAASEAPHRAPLKAASHKAPRKAAAVSLLAGVEATGIEVVAAIPLPVADVTEPAERVLPFFDAATETAGAPVARLDAASFSAPSATAFDDFFNGQRPGPELARPDVPAAEFAARPAAEVPGALRWDLELPPPSLDPVEARAARGQQPFATGAENWWRPAAVEPDSSEGEAIEVVEPLSIHANLIEFPRELVAARKARPRLVEGISAAAEPNMQLSIFEVDPVSISTEVEMETVAESAQAWSSRPAVAAPTWSGIELDAQPAAAARESAAEDFAEPHPASALEPAPAALRLMALVVDGALIAGSVLAASMLAATRASALPSPHAAEIGIGVALLLVAGLYEAMFFTLGSATPGMRYAQIRLSTFEGVPPARAERCKRLGALLVSALPAGLGLAWSIFDEDHLSWHDRLSRTYLCRR